MFNEKVQSNVLSTAISLEPHVKSLHLTLAYQFPSSQYSNLKALVDELDPSASASWELRLYSRDPRVNGKQVHKVVHPYTPIECDELELRTGDYVYLSSEALASSPDGWVEGTSWLTGLSGLLPESYTERTAESDAWTLHRKAALNLFNTSTNISNTTSTVATDISSSIKHPKPLQHTQSLPKDIGSGVYNTKPETENSENLYENMSTQVSKDADEIQKQMPPVTAQKLFIMRHGERVDFTFGSWIPYCFDEAGNYAPKDLNMPSVIPQRKLGPKGFLKDTPLTNVGILQANLVGKGLRENNVEIEHVYCSPSFRSIQTCDSVLSGLGIKDKIKIKIEPGLFEWLVWYPDQLPDWMTVDELLAGGYNIDEEYKPLITREQLTESRETCEQFYERSGFVAQSTLKLNTTGNILLVGHAATLDVCSRELVGGKPRTAAEMTKVIQRVSYCGLLTVAGVDNKWQIVETPCLPLTHSNNQRFDWKIVL